MKLVLAIVQPFKLDEVTRGLERIADFPGMTVAEVRGFGREHGIPPGASTPEPLGYFTAKVQVETVVRDEQVDAVVGAIAHAAHTGRYGDGMIFVLPVERTIRIATMKEGGDAL